MLSAPLGLCFAPADGGEGSRCCQNMQLWVQPQSHRDHDFTEQPKPTWEYLTHQRDQVDCYFSSATSQLQLSAAKSKFRCSLIKLPKHCPLALTKQKQLVGTE